MLGTMRPSRDLFGGGYVLLIDGGSQDFIKKNGLVGLPLLEKDCAKYLFFFSISLKCKMVMEK